MDTNNNGTHQNGNQKKRVAFDDAVPKRGPELFIKRMKAGEAKTFTCLGSKIRGLWVHWNGATEKSEPHFEEGCAACGQAIPKRWKGFLHCFCREENQQVYLELTPTAAQAILGQLSDPTTLRGTVLRVKRTPAANGRLQITIVDAVPSENILTRESDPRRSILKLWGIADSVANDWLGESEGETSAPGE